MNLFYQLFYSQWVTSALYPVPVTHWLFFNEYLAAFPTIADPLPGFTQASRRTKKVQLVVLHSTGSNDINKALSWFSNPNTYSSTNYLIDRDGHILYLVPEENAAFHTPNATYKHSRLVNESSIGCTLVGDGNGAFTEAQYEAVAMLCSTWKKTYSLQNEDIKKHSEISCTPMVFDPTPWDQNKLLALIELFDNL